jgi:hypothetical protein
MVPAAQDPDDLAARHEAGHAVTSYILRDYVGRVTIDSPDGKHAAGAEVWTLEPPLVDGEGKIVERDYTEDELQCLEDAAQIAIAGPVAETVYWEHREYDDVLMKNKGDQADVVTITGKGWGKGAREKELELVERVRALLEREWQRVERLATALEGERTVSGERARDLIEGTDPPHAPPPQKDPS